MCLLNGKMAKTFFNVNDDMLFSFLSTFKTFGGKGCNHHNVNLFREINSLFTTTGSVVLWKNVPRKLCIFKIGYRERDNEGNV